MARIRYATAIVVALVGIILYSSWVVDQTTDSLTQQLDGIQQCCSANNYQQAYLELVALNEYYQNKEHLLTLFIKRDYLANISVSINGLFAYAQPDNLPDLNSEIDKIKAQILMVNHLFFSLL